ncbi:MAG: DNA translocase FtsK [Phycisphaerae bacterium]|nr:DNA translocase FtsK [Phycisphaerae bacterium]
MARNEESSHSHRVLRSTVGLVGLVASLFLLVALVSFSPYDPPSPKAGVWSRPPHNWCGPAGAFLAYHLFYYVGSGGYTLLLFTVGGFGWFMVAQRVPDAYLRVIGVALLVVSTACAAALVSPADATSLPEGNGGVVGVAVTDFLARYFNTFGTVLALIGSAGVGLVLAADAIVVALPRWLASAFRHSRPAMAMAANATGRLVASIPAAMQSQAATAAPPVVSRPKPTRPEPPQVADAVIAPTDDLPGPPLDHEPLDLDDVEPEEVEADEPVVEDDELPMVESPARPVPSKVHELVIRSAKPQAKPATDPPPKMVGDYTLPPLGLLKDPAGNYAAEQEEIVRGKAIELEHTLAEFGVSAQVVQIDTGPVITMFELDLAAGTKVSQIVNLQNDIARSLAAQTVRIVAPIPGKRTVGIEVPNVNKEQVRIKDLIETSGSKPNMFLPMYLGKDASGDVLVEDLARMPHMLIAGTTGSGKSVCINTIVMSMLLTQRPDHVKMILVDPKAVEMVAFKDLPHLLCPIVTDMHKAAAILEWAVTKMEERYELLAEAGVRNISSFNRLTPEDVYKRFGAESEEDKARVPTHMPYMVIIIDELADLMMTAAKEVEHFIIRLAQKSRAIGIHLVVATQSPRVNVVTGLIKANMPCRCSFRVSSKQESRIVLDQNGSETLLGEGDMLFLKPGTAKLVRAQGTLVDDEEIAAIIGRLKEVAKPQFSQELIQLKAKAPEGAGGGEGEGGGTGERDELFDQATEIVLQNQRGSVSLLQRKLGIGYGRAARLIDQMAEAGLVGEYNGSNARDVQMTLEDWLALKRQVSREQNEGME